MTKCCDFLLSMIYFMCDDHFDKKMMSLMGKRRGLSGELYFSIRISCSFSVNLSL